MNLAVDPDLDVLDVGSGRQVDWIALGVNPGIYGDTSSHGWTSLLVADGLDFGAIVAKHAVQHISEDALLLHDWEGVSDLQETGER